MAKKTIEKNPNIIKRQEEWLKKRNEKLQMNKDIIERRRRERELNASLPMPKKKTIYNVTSKVK